MSEMFGCGWLWLYGGALLMLAELLTPGFVIFFFGLSAATVGLLRFLFGADFTLTWQLAAFSLFSIVYLVLLRRYLKRIFVGGAQAACAQIDHDEVGRIGKVVVAIAPPEQGRVVLGDLEWSALAAEPIAVGTTVRVVSRENLTVKVEKV